MASAVGGTWEYYATNALGDLLTTSGQAGSSAFTYNADENPATRTDAAGTGSYTYDTDGRLNTDTDASTGTTLTYQYNSLSQPRSVSYGTSGDAESGLGEHIGPDTGGLALIRLALPMGDGARTEVWFIEHRRPEIRPGCPTIPPRRKIPRRRVT
ncbi:hypothetical protein [Streptomyces sp. NPDC101776]|uniref:hypothetical protein n=1 Tax=Streptomyces sp. NPDC101776 TaxID=3366146 RepID=UPI003804F3D6